MMSSLVPALGGLPVRNSASQEGGFLTEGPLLSLCGVRAAIVLAAAPLWAASACVGTLTTAEGAAAWTRPASP